MAQDDVVQIRVGGQAVGIMGLKAAIEEMAEAYGEIGRRKKFRPSSSDGSQRKTTSLTVQRPNTERPFFANSKNSWGSHWKWRGQPAWR